MTVEYLTGLPASPGVACGTAYIYHHVDVHFERHVIIDTDAELLRLRNAIRQTAQELNDLEHLARATIGDQEAAIFEAHRLFLEDPELTATSEKLITDSHSSAEAAVFDAFEEYAQALEQADDAYFQARAADVRDVAHRVLRVLLGINSEMNALPSQPVVLLADDLTPSDTVHFDKNLILGIATAKGGPTSHTAILARSLGIPAVVSVPLSIHKVDAGSMIILDGLDGTVVIDPDPSEVEQALQKRDKWLANEQKHRAHAHEPAITSDGHRVEVVANIGGADDARRALELGAEGVGLFRTEFLFLDRTTLPSEDEQYEAYREVVTLMDGRPLVVRTLDIGGDKSVPYLGFAEEENPFLGWRAFRMVDEHLDVFETQFRALLRAGHDADLRIMVPMIANVEEVRHARQILTRVQQQLKADGVRYAENAQFGIMVEIPSAALIAGCIAPLVDFFSIGTNDLTQYTLAVDRTNPRVAPLADTFHPAVLMLIQHTIREAHAHQKWVGLCGEFAGTLLAAPLLLGFGLDEFSMAGIAVPGIKAALRRLNKADCERFVREVMSEASAQAIKAACETYMEPLLA
jgi:phosphoenolpyruvate-protein phosphotransferase